MPRKKTKAATRAKPVLPDGDEGKYLSHQEKLNKLDAYLKDLENKHWILPPDFASTLYDFP
jgi:hypothetical protein